MKDYLAGLLTRAILVTIVGMAIVIQFFLVGLRGVELQVTLIGAVLLALLGLVTFTIEWFTWGSPPRTLFHKEKPKR